MAGPAPLLDRPWKKLEKCASKISIKVKLHEIALSDQHIKIDNFLSVNITKLSD